MKRNIALIYFLSFLRTSWFWLGIWVFYYLRFTNYAGIGLIETMMIFSMTLLEIPTGAIADIFGRKNTLLIAFLFMALGNLYMGLTGNFLGIFIAVFIGGIGGTLYSGTAEALAYDSLKEDKNEERYPKVVANMSSLELISMTVCGAIGGYLYYIDPKLPFILAGMFNLIALVFCFWLIEPHIDSEKFSFKAYIIQTKQGFDQLFKSDLIIKQTILLIIIGGIMTISDEMLDSILAYEFGFNPINLGIFTSIVFAFGAVVSQFSNHFNFHQIKHLVFLGLIISLTYLISPWASIIIGGLSIIIRNGLRIIFLNNSSSLINFSTESKYRATTISTFNMLKNIPYLFSAYAIGSIMDLFTARYFSLYLGLFLILVMILAAILISRHPRTLPLPA